ncbi:MAG TPA: type II toxin-antitoxin system RelE/ParE family toxin [Terriglobales bacterium]|nr:type II toxin-antitoxin system RelE/ParE family toxin [Terriglobales bacterium]
MAWEVEFYEDPEGGAPVEEFLENLPQEARAKALAIIRLLQEQGAILPFPYSSQVRGPLRELRTHYGREHIRILYFGDGKRVFILLHGLIKRTQKLGEGDIRIAEHRMREHDARLRRRKK